MPLDAVGLALGKADARSRYDAVLGFNGTADRSRLVPTFTPASTSPMLTLTGGRSLSSMYWPYVVKATGVVPSPINRYYLYYSTDHDAGAGGIALATGPSPTGPWTDYGKVYTDTVTGTQTETPSVIWDETAGLFRMYYQQAALGINQSTAMATSPNGVTWTRYGIVIDIPNTTEWPGDGHTGYFLPFRVGYMWGGYHLMGGGNRPRFGLSWSHDGISWTLDPRPLHWHSDLYTAPASGIGPTVRVEWNQANVVQIHGRPWLIVTTTDFVSGTTPRTSTLGIAPLAPNFRRILHPLRPIYTPTQIWESADIRATTAYVEGSRIYVYYQCGTQNVGALVGGLS